MTNEALADCTESKMVEAVKFVYRWIIRELLIRKNVAFAPDLRVGIGSFINVADLLTNGPRVSIGTNVSIPFNGSRCTGVLIDSQVGIVSRYEHEHGAIGRWSSEDLTLGDPHLRARDARHEIRIGDDVWIDFNAMILSGVSIFRGAILAAASVVTKDDEPYTIVARNLAQKIGEQFDFLSRKRHESLLMPPLEPMRLPTEPAKRLALVSHSLDGHRREYVELMTRLLEAGGVETRLTRHWRATLSDPGPAFFLMIEESLPGYMAAALWRALLGRRTVGLLFRGREAVDGSSLRLRLKRWALRLLRRTPGVTTLSIVPFSVEPSLARLADDWIDDPQLWDVDDLNPAPTPLSEAVRAAAAGRRIVVSLGAQNAAKGFDFLTGAWRECPDLRNEWLFIAAGKVAPQAYETAARFEAEGGYLVDRFITNAELASLYRAADVIWGVYAPFYDQASGIFGRAVQYDAPILLRRGSAVETHGRELAARMAVVDYGAANDLADALEEAAGTEVSQVDRAPAMKARSEAILHAALMGRN